MRGFSPVNGIYNVERLFCIKGWIELRCFSPVNGIYNVESKSEWGDEFDDRYVSVP